MTYQDIENKEFTLKASIEKWRAMKVQLEQLQEEEGKLRLEILELVDHQDYVGNGVIITAYIRKGAIDYSAVPQLRNVDLEPFRKEPSITYKIVPSWRE